MPIDSFIRFINRKIHYLIDHRGLRCQKNTILCVIDIFPEDIEHRTIEFIL